MADDAHTKLRERMANVEKRALAWVYGRRPELKDKPLTEVIAVLRQENREVREAVQNFRDDQLDNAVAALRDLQAIVESSQSSEPG
jgi:signal transduction histidine kinase